MSTVDVNKLLSRWMEVKEEMSVLQKKLDKYRACADVIMNETGVDVLKSGAITLQRKQQTYRSLTKANVPTDIWEQYSSEVKRNAFYIKKTRSKNSSLQ